VNDLTDTQTNAHRLKYDSSYGAFPGTVIAGEREILVDDQSTLGHR
jgi:glyceraldehyde 3-phosphate dehydrogenase